MIDANSQFFAILTNVGMAKQANADALGIPWKITEMGVGDANNTDPIPNASQTTLINEWRRRPLNQLKIDPVNPAVLIAEQIIPADEGGRWIREIGLYDVDGDLVAVANCAPSFKPILSQGSGRTQIVRMNFIVTSTGNITLKIDPAIVLASRAYVDAAILEVLPKNKTPGEWTRVKTNDRGLVVSGDNPSTLAGMGITDAFTKAQIEAMIAQASALPVGATVAFPLDKVAPGFLELDGSVKSIAAYPDLATFLGTAFNKGDEGAGNFRLPESRGEFLRGWDHGRGIDAGRAIGSWQKGTMVSADTTGSGDGSTVIGLGANAALPLASYGIDPIALADYPSQVTALSSASTASSNVTVSGSARPRNLAVMWCIKAWNAPINQGNIDIAALVAIVEALRVNGPLVGEARNLRMALAAASATAAITADQLIVEQSGVGQYKLSNLNLSINLASVGAGGMDTGAAPVNGTVGIYVIYNPDTKLAKLLGVNATAAVVPEVYGGANTPAGYTASALVSVWQTNASGQLVTGVQDGRSVGIEEKRFLINGTATAFTALSLTGFVPRNAKSIGGYVHVITSATIAAGSAIVLASDSVGSGRRVFGSGGSANMGSLTSFSDLMLVGPLTLYYSANSSPAGSNGYVTSYTF
jgi:microcystin-dependent protein